MAGKIRFGGKLVAAILGVVILGGAAAYFASGTGAAGVNIPFFARPGSRGAGDAKTVAAEGPQKGGEYRQLALEPLVVNLADPGGRRYLRVAISLEFADANVEKEMEKAGYRVRDAIIQVLRSKTVADLSPNQSEEVRRELLNTINGLLVKSKISGIYFQEFIIQ